MALIQTRRDFVAGLGAAAGLAGIGIPLARADELLETTRLRLTQIPALCVVPQYMAEELLRARGLVRSATSIHRLTRSTRRSVTARPISAWRPRSTISRRSMPARRSRC